MATKPEEYPQIAFEDTTLPETGNTNKLRPPLEIRQAGYDYKQKLPVEEYNWQMHNIAQWIEYLDGLTRDQGITEIASLSQAQTGTANDVLMTPLRVLDSIKFNANPPGEVKAFAGTALPSGYLRCEGQAVSRTTYSRLFDAIGTTYGAGDGSTTFNLPDLRDDFIRGAHSGRAVGTRESYAVQSHSHTGNTNSAGTHTHTVKEGSYNVGVPAGNLTSGDDYTEVAAYLQTTSAAGSHTHSFTTNATGGSETRPRNVAMYWIIKF